MGDLPIRLVCVASILISLMPLRAEADDKSVFNKAFDVTDKPVAVAIADPHPTIDQKVFDRAFNIRRSITRQRTITETPTPPEWVYPLIIRDLQQIPVSQRILTRYLDLSCVFPNERKDLYAVTSVVLNSLGWSNSITRPEFVPGTNNRIVRLNFAWYSRNTTDIQRWFSAWERMTSFDEYYLEPWVLRQDANAAYQMSGSVGMVMRADFFCFYAMQQDDTSTNEVEGFYSDFLGLPNTESGLLSLLKVRLNEIAQLGADRRGLVVRSGTDSNAPPVAFNNRKVNRAPTVLVPHGGYFYYTQDFFNSRGKRNVLNDPLDNDKDGGEYIFSLPNYLQGYFLTAKQKVGNKTVFKQVSEVPIEIASSTFSHRRVKYNTCTNCHRRGINSYKDVFEEVLLRIGPPGGIILLTEQKPDAVLRARQLFSRDIKGYVNADQLNYSIALERASGMSPEVFSAVWKSVMETYEAPLDPRRAAWEFGTADIETYLADKVVSTTKGSLLLLIKAKLDEKVINRDTFEEEYRNGKLLQQVKANVVSKAGVRVRVIVPSTVTGVLTEPIPAPTDQSTWWIRNYPSSRRVDNTDYYPPKGRDPLSYTTLQQWIAEGRVDAQTELWSAKLRRWVPAQILLPNLFRR